jgi:hypothetical protein
LCLARIGEVIAYRDDYRNGLAQLLGTLASSASFLLVDDDVVNL